MANEPEPPVETDPTGRFTRFRSILGRGAYKTVYRAFDTDEALEVAWNKLHVERLSKHDLEKVSNEVELLKRVHHNNIIRFYHTWTNPSGNGAQTIDFITEQMTSGTLKEYLKKAKAIKLKVIRRWCSNILEAIAYLHAQKPPIMHRDLKCENIFINGHVGEVKIGDLGLSGVKVRDKADSVIGTPEFMAPELYEESYTEKVDIYAFGMCLLEMVAMEYPYSECTNLAQIFRKVYNNERPKAFDRIVECDVKKVIAACLRREENRPSAAELLQDPLFRDWREDNGKETNLTLLNKSGDGNENRATRSRGNGTAGYGANVIDWSDQLNRTVLMSMPDGDTGNEAEQGANVSVVASQADETGGFSVALEIPFGDKIKRVKFTFDPFKDNSKVIAQEMVNEFNLAVGQLLVIEEEIERQVLTARQQREAASRNATPQPLPRNVVPVSSSAVSAENSVLDSQNAVPQPIEALRTPDVPEQAVAAPPVQSQPLVQSQSGRGIAQDVVPTTVPESAPAVEKYPTNEAPIAQAQPHPEILLPPQPVPENGNAQNGNVEQVYHQELQTPQPPVQVPSTLQALPSDTAPPAAIPSSNASDSGYYSAPPHEPEQSIHFEVPEEIPDLNVEGGLQSHSVSMASVHHEAQGKSQDIPSNPNDNVHVQHPVGVSAGDSLPYSQISSSSQGNPSAEFGQGRLGRGSGSESIAPQVSAQLPPAKPAQPEMASMPSGALYNPREPLPQSGEVVNRQSPPRPTQSLTFAEPLPRAGYSDDNALHHRNSSQQQHAEPQSRSSESGHYNVLPPISSVPMPAVHSEVERSVPPNIPQSASEHQMRTANDTGDLTSPHRSISAPVGTIVIDDAAEFPGRRHGASPMPNDMIPILIPNLQSAASDDIQGKGIVSGVDQTTSSHSGTSSVPSSRPPSIVVVGGERRSSSREKRHMSVPSLSAKSFPEYSRNEASKVPRSTSLMANVADASRYPVPHEKDAVLGSGTNSFSGHASASPSGISRRSSSWRSSQSDESSNDVALRASTPDTVLGTAFDQKGLTACLELLEHCAKGRFSSVLQKLDQGTPAHFADYDKRTALHLASARGHMEVCILLLDRGANVSAKDRWGRTPLSDAKRNRHEAVVDLLKKHGAVEDIDMSSDVASLQLLQYAAKGDLELVRDRIVAGASATYADYDQRTALHLACTEGHAEVAELLLVNNADPAALDARGRTPVDDAVTNGHRNILRVLRQYGAEIPRHLMGAHSDSNNQLGLDLVENAAKGRMNAVSKCLHNGANPNFQDYDKRTALHLASVEGHIDIVEVLLQAGADATMRDRWGATPRHEALKEHRTAVVDELDNWEKRMAEKNASSRDMRSMANGKQRAQSLRQFHARAGPDGEGLRPAAGPSASINSLAMHADMYVQKYPSSAPSAAPLDTQHVNPPALQTSANFEKLNESADGEIEEEERRLQAEYNEKLRRLRESRSASQNPPRRTPVDESDSSTVTWRQQSFPPPGTTSISSLSVVVPRATSPVIGAISEIPVAAPVAERNTKDIDVEVAEQAVEAPKCDEDDKAEELASEIVDDIIDLVVQDCSESEGNVM